MKVEPALPAAQPQKLQASADMLARIGELAAKPAKPSARLRLAAVRFKRAKHRVR
jgi:hypothetical protein